MSLNTGFEPRPLRRVASGGELSRVMLALKTVLAAVDRVPTLVVFDEFQDLLVARKDLDGLLRSRIQYHQDAAAYVYAGSEPSMMRELFDVRERPLFGQADPLTLAPLPLEETLADLVARFAADGADPGDALVELVAFGAGHPQRTMLLAYLLSDRLSHGAHGTPELAAAVAAGFLVGIGSTATRAHDEDWRKLLDRLPPFEGPPVLGPVAATSGFAGDFPADNVTLLSWLPISEFPGTHMSASDCWGYTSPSGREYAMIGLQKGTAFVEITNPTLPRIVEYVPGATSLWHDIKVLGHYAYGVSEGGLGIQVMDMSRIDELIARNSEAQTGCPVTYSYTDDSLRTLLEGFRIVDLHKAHIFTWDLDAYRKQPLVAGVAGGSVKFNYSGKMSRALETVPFEHARWFAGIIGRLTDEQLRAAFKAAGASETEVTGFATRLREKINELEAAVGIDKAEATKRGE